LIKFDQFLIMGCGSWLADHSALLGAASIRPNPATTAQMSRDCPRTFQGRLAKRPLLRVGWVGPLEDAHALGDVLGLAEGYAILARRVETVPHLFAGDRAKVGELPLR
jgi:hypothetical protein